MTADNPAAAAINAPSRRVQRHATMLRDVSYLILARIELTAKADRPDDTVAKHHNIFNDRLVRGRCFSQPYFGTRECTAYFRAVHSPDKMPPDTLPSDQRNRELGRMPLSVDRLTGAMPRMFDARLRNGILHVPPPAAP